MRDSEDDAPRGFGRDSCRFETVERDDDHVHGLCRRQIEAAVLPGVERRDDALAAEDLDVRARQRQPGLIDDDTVCLRAERCRRKGDGDDDKHRRHQVSDNPFVTRAALLLLLIVVPSGPARAQTADA